MTGSFVATPVDGPRFGATPRPKERFLKRRRRVRVDVPNVLLAGSVLGHRAPHADAYRLQGGEWHGQYCCT